MTPEKGVARAPGPEPRLGEGSAGPRDGQIPMNLCWAFLLAFVLSYLLGFAARAVLARYGVVDLPNQRSSHDTPVMRGGGAAVLVAAAIAAALSTPPQSAPGFYWVALAGLVLAVVSFLDDLRSLPQVIRLGVQAGAAIIALAALGLAGAARLHPLFAAILGIAGSFWIVGYTNAFNFMDGVNGMAGMQAVVTGVGTALVAVAAGGSRDHPAVVLATVIAGAGAGFLPHNFPRARMFLGDVGSAPLGFLLSVLAFWLARDLGWYLLGAFGLLHANFVLDTAITLVRRIMKGERLLESHRDHFYQLLVRAGKSHRFVTAWEGALQVVVLLVVLASVRMGWAGRAAAVGIVFAIWLTFFAYAGLTFRRRSNAADAR